MSSITHMRFDSSPPAFLVHSSTSPTGGIPASLVSSRGADRKKNFPAKIPAVCSLKKRSDCIKPHGNFNGQEGQNTLTIASATSEDGLAISNHVLLRSRLGTGGTLRSNPRPCSSSPVVVEEERRHGEPHRAVLYGEQDHSVHPLSRNQSVLFPPLASLSLSTSRSLRCRPLIRRSIRHP